VVCEDIERPKLINNNKYKKCIIRIQICVSKPTQVRLAQWMTLQSHFSAVEQMVQREIPSELAKVKRLNSKRRSASSGASLAV
jgi:hypothetical protein